ncbi:MAG: hypothetical protein WBO73_15240 [Gammaproteobacteria bacterium]
MKNTLYLWSFQLYSNVPMLNQYFTPPGEKCGLVDESCAGRAVGKKVVEFIKFDGGVHGHGVPGRKPSEKWAILAEMA